LKRRKPWSRRNDRDGKRYVRRVKRGDNTLELLPDQFPLCQVMADNAMRAVVAGIAISSLHGMKGGSDQCSAKYGNKARLENRVCQMTQHGAISR
jgi:hypothetical protein